MGKSSDHDNLGPFLDVSGNHWMSTLFHYINIYLKRWKNGNVDFLSFTFKIKIKNKSNARKM